MPLCHFISYIYLSLLSNARLHYFSHQDSFYQACTARLHQLYHQCSNEFHLSHLRWSHQLHVGLYHCYLAIFQKFLDFRLLPAVFSMPTFSGLSNKVSQDLTFIWWMSRAMDKTSEFQSILWMIYITFSELASTLTHLWVISSWGRFSSHFPAETKSVSIYPSGFLIRMLYNIFKNIFCYLHVFNHVYRFV